MKTILLLLIFLLAGPCCAQVTVSPPPPDAYEGKPYSHQFVATGGTGPYAWTSGGVGNLGLALNPTTGVLSGTPGGSHAPYSVVITATDSLGAQGSLYDDIRLGPAPAPDRTSSGPGGCSVGNSTVTLLQVITGLISVIILYVALRRAKPI